MTEWIISSSVLITAVLILRRVLRGKLSPGIQYALWAIVLIRLLMPFSLFSSDLSIHNVQEQVSKRPEVQQIQQVIQAPGHVAQRTADGGQVGADGGQGIDQLFPGFGVQVLGG